MGFSRYDWVVDNDQERIVAISTKPRVRKAKKLPPRGRKLNKKDARDFVFKTYREAMVLLAKH